MSKKPRRATEDLNLELSKISTASSMIKQLLGEPMGDGAAQQRALTRLASESHAACERAFEHLTKIMQTVSTI